MKSNVRRANVYFNLEKLYELTNEAMAEIDSNYWKKCIGHMKKEIHYYMEHDGLHNQVESQEMETESKDNDNLDHFTIQVCLVIDRSLISH